MTPSHDQVLAVIEARAASRADCPDEVDTQIAAELGVAPEHYVAYLLVAGAVERYRDQELRQPRLPIGPDVGADPLARADALSGDIGWQAARIYRDTVGAGHTELHTTAAGIIGAATQLRACLHEVAAERVLASAELVPVADRAEASDGR